MKHVSQVKAEGREFARKWLYQIEKKAIELRRALQKPPPYVEAWPCLLELAEGDLEPVRGATREALAELHRFEEFSSVLAKQISKDRQREAQANLADHQDAPREAH